MDHDILLGVQYLLIIFRPGSSRTHDTSGSEISKTLFWHITYLTERYPTFLQFLKLHISNLTLYFFKT